MGREVRMVPSNWQHPKDDRGRYIPLYPAEWYESVHAEWVEENDPEWEEPTREQFMPYWPVEQRTYFMMYENTSEGTPISSAFETAEMLAKWLADTDASALGSSNATYEQWLSTIQRGWAVSMVFTNGVLQSGVAAD